jgi:GTPase SAR1 family protein
MSTREIHMIMLGPGRVGKSSLLATMYREIEKLKVGFELEPAGETRDRLKEAYENLSSVMEREVFVPVGDLIKGTEVFVEYRLGVTFRQSRVFDLVFHDFRGGALTESGNEYKTLHEKVTRSHVIFNLLDAVTLMELDTKDGNERNAHEKVSQLLHRALQPNEKYLILFVLVKCESYIKTASSRERLVKRFEERHAPVLQLINNRNLTSRNVVGLLIPVITLGCVEFKKIDSKGNYIFDRNHRDFEPREVDQPLRYALAFALNRVEENRGFFSDLWRYLSGEGQAFNQALRDFCKQRKTGYKIYGNPDLLRVN